MSFSLRHGRGGSHQFERPESGSLLGYCRKCLRPFIGVFMQTPPVCCRKCNFVACQGCASNQADWESSYRCASARTSTQTYQDLEDVGEQPDRSRSRVMPPGVQKYGKELLEKHDQLLDCIRELRATTRIYGEEVKQAMSACADEMEGSYSDHSLHCPIPNEPGAIEIPSRVLEVMNERLARCTNVLIEQAVAVRDLTTQLRTSNASSTSEGRDGNIPQEASRSNSDVPSGGVHTGGGCDLWQATAVVRTGGGSVPAVPIVGASGPASNSPDSMDVSRLLHKVFQYRSDAEIEEGLCARLSTVPGASILAQVERMLPALTNIVLYSEQEMVFLTREIIRLCMSSIHFASRFMWCLRTAWPKEAGFAHKLQQVMCTSDFSMPVNARLAKLIWLATYAVSFAGAETAPERRWEEEHELLSLATEPFNRYVLKAALARRLRLIEQRLAASAHLMPFVACTPSTRPPYSLLVLSKQHELAVVTEPMQERLELEPGRYTLEITNLESASGSNRQAAVFFAIELPGCSPEALEAEASSGESVVLHLEVPTSMASHGEERACKEGEVVEVVGKVRVIVKWKDDYQLAFSVRLSLRVELPDFECPAGSTALSLESNRSAVHSVSGVGGQGGGQGGGRSSGGGSPAKVEAKTSRRHAFDDDMEKAIRLSLQTHKQETRLLQALRAVSRQHKFVEELVEISRHLIRHRRALLAGAGVFARGGEADSANVVHLLNRELHSRLEVLERCIPHGAYMMMRASVDMLEEILAFVVSECKVLQTPHKVHYMLVVEIRRVENRTCAQACQAPPDHDHPVRARYSPYISSLVYEHQTPTVTRVKGAEACVWGTAETSGRSGNALAESFVVVKDDKHEAVSDFAPASAARSSSSPSAAHGSCSTKGRGKLSMGSGLPKTSSSPFGMSWDALKAAIRERSSFANKLGKAWDCASIIVKSHDDLRQDQLAADLLFLFDRAFKADKLDLPLRPYAVLATCEDGGLLETLTDALAIDTLKKRMASKASANGSVPSFANCFEEIFGKRGSPEYLVAQKRFVASMAAYSVFCYVLHIKDRHNGNIMLCKDGSIAHIDFGIMLNVRYAKDVLELRIKLSSEFVQVIGDRMQEFEEACCKGFLSIRRHSRELLQLLEMSAFAGGAGTALPCLERDAIDEVRKRLKPNCSDSEAQQHMSAELQRAKEHFSTGLLDQIHSWTHANV